MEGIVSTTIQAVTLPLWLPGEILQYWRYRRAISNYGDLSNKVVMVTGASSGIGRELAIQMHRQGARLILASRSTDRLTELAEELGRTTSKYPVNIPRVLSVDLEDAESLDGKGEEAWSLFGHIDILVNCGGLSVRGGALETEMSVYRRLMETNFFGTVQLTRAIGMKMKSQGSGSVVVISSVQGRLAIPHRAAYSASKHAIQAFSDSLRAELADYNVHVLVVSPGYVNTDLSKNSLTATGDKHNKLDTNTRLGYSAEYVAKEIIKAILSRDKEVILAPLLHKLALLLRSLLSPLYFTIMAKRAAKERSTTYSSS